MHLSASQRDAKKLSQENDRTSLQFAISIDNTDTGHFLTIYKYLYFLEGEGREKISEQIFCFAIMSFR